MKDALRAQLDNAYVCFERSTRALTEEDSTFTPADGTFTAAGQVAHAAQTIDWFVEGAFRREGFDTDFEAHHRDVRAVTSLTEARAWLTRSVENARQVIANRTEEEWAGAPPAGGGNGWVASRVHLQRHHRPHGSSPRCAHDIHAGPGQGAAEPVRRCVRSLTPRCVVTLAKLAKYDIVECFAPS